MKVSQTLMTSCCLLVAILCTLCSGQTWRPQGRFGKRLSPDDTTMPDFGFSHSHEIPVEAFFSVKDITQFKSKPRLCSLTGIQGYPVCDFSTLSAGGETEDWGTIFDM